MKKNLYQALIIMLVVLSTIISGCSINNKSETNTAKETASMPLEKENETASALKNSISTPDNSISLKDSDEKKIGNGIYIFDDKNSQLNITFTASNTDEQEDYYDTYNWVCSLPEGYSINEYSSAIICFNDIYNGIFLSCDGSAAGSSYYTAYFTNDGGTSWVKYSKSIQKTNTMEKLFFINDETAVLFDSGIGLSYPTITIIKTTNDNIAIAASHVKLNSVPQMIKSFNISEVKDDTHFVLEYEEENSSIKKSCIIDISQFVN